MFMIIFNKAKTAYNASCMRFKYKHLIYLVIWILMITFRKFKNIIMTDLPKNDFNSHNLLTEKNKKILSEILANEYPSDQPIIAFDSYCAIG